MWQKPDLRPRLHVNAGCISYRRNDTWHQGGYDRQRGLYGDKEDEKCVIKVDKVYLCRVLKNRANHFLTSRSLCKVILINLLRFQGILCSQQQSCFPLILSSTTHHITIQNPSFSHQDEQNRIYSSKSALVPTAVQNLTLISYCVFAIFQRAHMKEVIKLSALHILWSSHEESRK